MTVSTTGADAHPWRKEPEISSERQADLAQALHTLSDIRRGIYPFKGMRLSRADIEWLLATHEGGRGPVAWADAESRPRAGLDLRGAILSGADLSNLPLTRLIGGLDVEQGAGITTAQRKEAALRLEGANLRGAHLEGAILYNARLDEAALQGAHLEIARLRWAVLTGANLRGAILSGADLSKTHLEACSLRNAQVGDLDLSGAFFDAASNVCAAYRKAGKGVRFADVDWGGVKLAEVEWANVVVGDEQVARRTGQIEDYKRAVRAYRQIALALQEQGMSEEAMRFASRAQCMQRVVLRKQRHLARYGSSLFLDLLAGYGYKPTRSFAAYLAVICLFMALYHLLGHQLAWNEAFVVSMTAFHGRGFFPGTFTPGDPLAFASALEALVGLIIEVTFIATLTQRLFGK